MDTTAHHEPPEPDGTEANAQAVPGAPAGSAPAESALDAYSRIVVTVARTVLPSRQ